MTTRATTGDRPATPPTPRYPAGTIHGVVFTPLECHEDDRGWLIELFRSDEISADLAPQMAYLSLTMPGVVRGPHEHREQTDCFAFVGPGDFRLYLWDHRPQSPTFGHRHQMIVGETNKQSVVIPPGVVHAYKNISDVPAYYVNLPNRLYAGAGKKYPVDEIRHETSADQPFDFEGTTAFQ